MASLVEKLLIQILVPVLELVMLRQLLYHEIGFRPGFPNLTDYDFLVPAPLAFGLLFFLLHVGNSIRPKWDLNWGIGHLLGIFGLLFVSRNFEWFAVKHFLIPPIVWFGSLFLIALSSQLMWFRPSYFLKNSYRAYLIPCSLMSISIYLFMNSGEMFWDFYGPLTQVFVEKFVNIFSVFPLKTSFSQHRMLILEHPFFSVQIGKGCSGGDGLILFTLAYATFIATFRDKFSNQQVIKFFFLGMISMFFMNLFRIAGLFTIGVVLTQWLGKQEARWWFENVFHLHLGWILYFVATASFFSVLFRRKILHRSYSQPFAYPI